MRRRRRPLDPADALTKLGKKSPCRIEHVLFLFYNSLLSRPTLDDATFQKHLSLPMTFAPFLEAPFVIQIHVFAAIGALTVGLVHLMAPKEAATDYPSPGFPRFGHHHPRGSSF
jgi:hypothetical protein